MNNEHENQSPVHRDKESPDQPGSIALPRTSTPKQQSTQRSPERTNNPSEPSNESALRESTTDTEITQLIAVEASSWSGIIPDPQVFASYPPEIQQKWIAWADATIIDESKRQDKIVEAEIEQAKAGQNIAIVFGLFLLIASFISAFWFHNALLTGIFLGLPAIKLVTGFIVELGENKNHKKE